MAYKAVRLDRTSHYDGTTKWRVGATVRPNRIVEPSGEPCGFGIHVCPTLFDAIERQGAPSRYYVVEPTGTLLGSDEHKSRWTAVKVMHELTRKEQDEMARFRLWEANHPVCPLRGEPRQPTASDLRSLRKWVSVHESVRGAVSGLVLDTVYNSMGYPGSILIDTVVWGRMGTAMRIAVGIPAWALGRAASVRAALWAYAGSLFPAITVWQRAEQLGPCPWDSLRRLWLRGFLPSFDGVTWRLHSGKQATVVYKCFGS